MSYAACRDMAPAAGEDDPFFPAPGRRDLVKVAKAVCNTCPVLAECGDWKERSGAKHGMFAGEMSGRGRSR